MTLATIVRIQSSNITPAKLFLVCQEIVETPETVRTPSFNFHGDTYNIMNPVGIGAKALLWVTAPVDGGLLPQEEGEPKGFLEVGFDIAYGAKGGCDTISNELVLKLGAWLEERGVSWYAKNEYTDEWFYQSAPY